MEDTKRLTEKEVENYAYQFVKETQNYLNNYRGIISLNPFLQNELMKSLYSNPVRYKKEDIEKMIADPKHHEKALRDLSEYIYNKIMSLKRISHYFGNMLEFDWYLEPINADLDSMRTSAFKRAYKKCLEFIDKIDVKYTYPKIMNVVMLQDTFFAFMRKNDDYIVYQQMPSDYCMITYENELGYGYDFDCSYFMRPGVDIDEYDPIFKEYFEEYRKTDGFKYGYPFWIRLNNDIAPVFKFDTNRASSTPPFLGAFTDAIEIEDYKQIYKKNAEIQTTKLLINKIPMKKESNVHTKDNFAIDAKTAGIFNNIIKESIPEMIISITSPLEAELLDFNKQGSSKNNIVEEAYSIFFDGVGTSSTLFGDNPTGKTGIRSSQKTDEYFVKHMYKQFERHLNYHLNKISNKFKFRIHFEGTMWDREERFERAFKMVSIGAPLTYLAVANGKTPTEIENMTNLERAMGLKDNLQLVESIHTASPKSGRPKSDDDKLTDDGEASRDNEVNENY